MAFRSSTSLTPGNGNSAAVPVPTGAAVDDIAVVGIYKESTSAITPPLGFTQKASLTTSATARGSLVVFWKRLTAADSGTYSFTWSGSTWRGAVCGLWSGRTTSGDPFDGTVGTAESTTTVSTLNVSTSPAAADGDAVGMWTNFNGGASFTPPTNYTERQDTTVITLDSRDAVASGTTGSVSATATITDFMKAFLGVLAVAAGGGTDATATPSAIAATTAAPQATPTVSDSGTPDVTAAIVAVPQVNPIGNATVSPAVTATVAAVPQATPVTAGNATATPATIAAVTAVPQATPSGAATATPAPTATVVALPQATPTTSGSATAAPATIAASIAFPQATPSGAAVRTPATIAALVAAPAAMPAVSDIATPAVLAATTLFPQASLSGAATATPQVLGVTAAAPRAAVAITVGPASFVTVVSLPHASAIDEGAQVNGTSTPTVTGLSGSSVVAAMAATSAVSASGSSTPAVSDG